MSRVLCRLTRYHFVSYKHPTHLGVKSIRKFSDFGLKSQFPREIAEKIVNNFDHIRNDSIPLNASQDSFLRKNMNLRSYPTLSKYVKELNAVLRKATFIGCTIVEKEKNLDNAILHFRGYERGESACLCFSPNYFPLYPTCTSPYRGVTERSLDYFEHVLSGLTGLRVSGMHTPYAFRSIIQIDFADATNMENVLYKIVIVSERTNKMLLVDNTDQIVLGSSECLLEDELKDNEDVGKKLQIKEPKKLIPRADETFKEFITNFKSYNNTSVIKAFLSVYEGLDYNFISGLCKESEVDPGSYFYKIPDVNHFYEQFIKKVKSTLENDGHYEDLIRQVYDIFGSLSPAYRLNRLIEKTLDMAKDLKRRLEASAAVSEKEGNEEKLAVLNEKLEGIEDYQIAIENISVSRDPKKLENLEDFHEQILMISDLVAYKAAAKKKKLREARETKVQKKTTKVGRIMSVAINDREDSPVLIVGKNAKQNEVVTHELRQKGDLWLHTKDCPGAHVILRNYANDEHSVQIAADVASFMSKNRQLANVEVVVADIAKVRKEKHSLLGAVLVEEFKTVIGSPERGAKVISDHKVRTQASPVPFSKS
ncbi:uncharacterized protein TOT_010000951 [Theileria orientalis strain Shintoku]|uniref:NFACT RNA-binding domain-containing protein n=1 Tax=Theileria orientalis strain Shintoku TaxID=869250 RepID=J4C2Y4_THEOR|nr:uncharacterized protein TOT_010000951 [Theileria orientalis strain Shintoku]PVC53977.1 hypothetical protein MACL_00003387 [Theileria orientalis]BAM39496.1 uncharacterized protein TOT_010000951 [Theileria orientalis strain Shintoku]|eukprot:XP_009689797.1 uncharacterized protein TOT_010000951 [Theileria orientalis strain Shintoku]